jgi:hypothetical protein
MFKMTFITHGFRVSVVSDVRERVETSGSPLRFMLRRSSLVECVSVLRGTETPSDGKSSYCLWQGLLKRILKCEQLLICELKRALYGIKCVLRIF